MGPILMNDRHAQWEALGADVLEAVAQLADSGAAAIHSPVERLQTALAGMLRVPYVIGCASALDALEIALRAVGISCGDKVLTSPLSDFIATAAIIRIGAVPVFVDVDSSGLIDLNASEAALHSDPSIRHMLPAHEYGHALDLQRLERLRREYRLSLVEDASRAARACWRGTPVATVGQASATGVSPAEQLWAMRDVGAVLTTDPELAHRARAFAMLGRTARDQHDSLGLHSPLDALHALILEHAIVPRMEAWIARRREIAERYLTELDHPQIEPLPIPADSDSVWSAFPIRVANATREYPDQRSDLIAHLEGYGVASELHCPVPIPEQRALSGVPFYVHGSLTHTRELCQQLLTLPIHPHMTDEQVTRVIATVNTWARPMA